MRKSLLVFSIVLLALSLTSLLNPPSSFTQSTAKAKFGGAFSTIRPEQQRLVRSWVAEYNKLNGSKLSATRVYDQLPNSFRTTFDAVTHALLNTTLTDESGKTMGKAIDLVEMIESIHGQVQGVSGDKQFRLYVLLRKDAVDQLYACREFKRGADNSIFHKGYPINFRQDGGAPSIQFSMTRTGRRADIDVDYRSSKFYKALFDGHLTAANSDVRAGNNYVKHTDRWEGLQNWWKDLFDRIFVDDKGLAEAVSGEGVSEKPRVNASKPVEEAVRDFYQAWLVEQQPKIAASYISVKAYPCIVEFQDGSEADSPLAEARILKQMRTVNASLGKVARLEDVIRTIPGQAERAKPVKQSYPGLFRLEMIPDDVAYNMDCRIRLNLKLVEEIPKPDSGFSNFYTSTAHVKTGDNTELDVFQVWSKLGNEWRLIAFHYENPFQRVKAPQLAAVPPVKVANPAVAADDEVSRQTGEFLTSWLIKRESDKALLRIAPAALDCAAEEAGYHTSSERDPAKRARDFLDLIAREMGSASSLSQLLVAPDVAHEQVLALSHPLKGAYVLARVSDDLSDMFSCANKLAGRKFAKTYTAGGGSFTRNHYLTMFRVKRAGVGGAAFAMLWEKQGDTWKVIAFDVIT